MLAAARQKRIRIHSASGAPLNLILEELSFVRDRFHKNAKYKVLMLSEEIKYPSCD